MRCIYKPRNAEDAERTNSWKRLGSIFLPYAIGRHMALLTLRLWILASRIVTDKFLLS